MLFFSLRAAPDPDGLVLDAPDATRHRALRRSAAVAAGGHVARLLARLQRERRSGR